jgi:hypothetical protein
MSIYHLEFSWHPLMDDNLIIFVIIMVYIITTRIYFATCKKNIDHMYGTLCYYTMLKYDIYDYKNVIVYAIYD